MTEVFATVNGCGARESEAHRASGPGLNYSKLARARGRLLNGSCFLLCR